MAYYCSSLQLAPGRSFHAGRLWRTLIEALRFTLPVIILGGIFGGFVTATEAAGLCCACGLGG